MTPTNDSKITQSQTEITCRRDGAAFNHRQRQRHQEQLERVQSSVQQVKGLEDGYVFCFPSDAEQIITLAEFISLERRCCPFVKFKLEIGSYDEPIWLRLTGGSGVKEFLRTELC